jgi:hypothetical protein
VALTPAIAVAAAAVLSAGYLDGYRGLPWQWQPIIGKWATAADNPRVGSEIGARGGGATVQAPPEIGTLAYFCECATVDAFSDRGRVVRLVDTEIAEAGPLTAGTHLRVAGPHPAAPPGRLQVALELGAAGSIGHLAYLVPRHG